MIGESPAAGSQVNPGSAVALVTSVGVAPTPAPNPLSLMNNYFVTGDYAAAGVTLRGTGIGGMATGTINIPDSTTNPGSARVFPTEPTLSMVSCTGKRWRIRRRPRATPEPSLAFPSPASRSEATCPYTDGALTGTLRVYRADVNTYFPVGRTACASAPAPSRYRCLTAEEADCRSPRARAWW